MTRLRISLALVLIAAVAVCSAAQSVDDVLNRAMNAMGGKANFEQIKSMKMSLSGTMMGMTMNMEMNMVKPNMLRNDITMMGQQITQATNGEDYWMSNAGQVMDMDEMTKSSFENSQLQFAGDLSALRRMGDLTYGGMETVNGVQAETLKLAMEQEGMSITGTMYFDASSGLLFLMKMATPMGETETTISDYRDIGGVKFAHKIEMVLGGNPMMTLTIDDLQMNVPIEESIFNRPQ